MQSSYASVLNNGSPTKEFNISKGVRKGDPISPFLFIIAMEGLNVTLEATRGKGLYTWVTIPNGGPTISQLFYADDTLFIREWSSSNLKNPSHILKCFHVSSVLKLNFHKSKIFGIGASTGETTKWPNILGCDTGSLLFNYLGVPVDVNMNLLKNWKSILDQFQYKLSVEKSKTLSFDGRLTLIKLGKSSILLYLTV